MEVSVVFSNENAAKQLSDWKLGVSSLSFFAPFCHDVTMKSIEIFKTYSVSANKWCNPNCASHLDSCTIDLL